MRLVLDASAALAWFAQRADPHEAILADEVLSHVQREEALVPALWFTEVANGLLVAEHRNRTDSDTTARFFAELDALPISEDTMRPSAARGSVLMLARNHRLTAYDATYLELALRTGRALATFDRQLADAVRKAGGRVFGDAP